MGLLHYSASLTWKSALISLTCRTGINLCFGVSMTFYFQKLEPSRFFDMLRRDKWNGIHEKFLILAAEIHD